MQYLKKEFLYFYKHNLKFLNLQDHLETFFLVISLLLVFQRLKLFNLQDYLESFFLMISLLLFFQLGILDYFYEFLQAFSPISL